MGGHDPIEGLAALNRAFYERTYRSFSATRQDAWQGWDELWPFIETALGSGEMSPQGLRVADIACGNLRFVRFLRQKTKAPLTVFAFDECEPLLSEGLRALSDSSASPCTVHEIRCDIAGALGANEDFMEAATGCDLVVAFGIMHHLATQAQRERLLKTMADHSAEGGLIVASFWRFASDERMLAKARATTARAQREGVIGDLSGNDYVLGWQEDEDAYRFCHHFPEDEIDAIAACIADEASEIARFSADGKSGDMNRYVVWRRHG